MAARAVMEGTMAHYYAIAEHGLQGGWFLTVPGGAGYSFALHAEEIVAEAQDYLASVVMAGPLPRSVEDGAALPDVAGFDGPTLVVVIPFERKEAEAAP
jgi:hypothetical protein